MVLVDTSVWVEHLRKADHRLSHLLSRGTVACHPLIIGELACGNLKNRSEVIGLLRALPQCKLAEHDEVLYFIEQHELMGRGIGIVDTSLLASCCLTRIPLWTGDRRLQSQAERLGMSYRPT